MTVSRRTFLEYCAVAAAATHPNAAFANPSRRRAVPSHAALHGVHAGDPPNAEDMHALARRALEAAIAAGATYADVRLTHTLAEQCGIIPLEGAQGSSVGGLDLVLGMGVRAVVRGYWGFAASPYWTPDEAAWLGQEAYAQARENANAGLPRTIELGVTPAVRAATWIMPGIDPFTVPLDEKLDALNAITALFSAQDRTIGTFFPLTTQTWREQRVFASSDGASYTQVRYRTRLDGKYGVTYDDAFQPPAVRAGRSIRPFTPYYGHGWELIRDLRIRDDLPKLIADAKAQSRIPAPRTKHVTVGRYDVVFAGMAAAKIVSRTFGKSTMLDRALGYEANAAGTSYLGPNPFDFLGTAVAAPSVTISANRSIDGALNTVRWDDEGVVPQPFTIVQHGELVDYQTTRELSGVLAPWYQRTERAAESHGCAFAATALDCPIQMMPNVTLDPGKEAVTVEDLIKDTQHGVYFDGTNVYEDAAMDIQLNSGMYGGPVGPREIVNGRLGDYLDGGAIMFNTPELWKNVTAVGGPSSPESVVRLDVKGQPTQSILLTASAAPMKVSGVALIDANKKA